MRIQFVPTFGSLVVLILLTLTVMPGPALEAQQIDPDPKLSSQIVEKAPHLKPGPMLCKAPKLNLAAESLASKYHTSSDRQQVDKVVKVYFHICRNDDGTNAAISLDTLEQEFEDLLEDYTAGGICFANMGYDFVDNTEINTSINPDFTSDVQLLTPFLVPDCLNIFYHANLINYGGNAYNIPNTFCSIAKGNIGVWRTLSHEVGHCLGLSHTFTTGFGEGYINGDSCAYTGDKVCDTAVDPFNDGACFTSNGCNYTGTCTDPSGNSNYSPPYDNIMSYYGSLDCTVDVLTPGQYSRALSFMASDAGLQGVQAWSSIPLESVSVSSGYMMLAAIWTITTENIVSFSGSVEASLKADNIVLNPGFSAQPSTGSVRIGGTACDNE